MICDEPYYDIELSDGRIINLYECRIDDLPNYSESFNEEDEEFEIINTDRLLYENSLSGGFGGIKLAVYGGEGMTPHFHFYKGCNINGGIPESKVGTGGCICIKDPLYFIHPGNHDTMNSRQIKKLLKFLKSPVKKSKRGFKGESNWEYIIFLWNTSNEDSIQVPEDQKIPPYTSKMDGCTD